MDLVPITAGEKVHVLDVCGNKWRVVTWIRYTSQTVFIKRVYTHKQYDDWNNEGRPV